MIHRPATKQANVKRMRIRNVSIPANGECDHDLPRHIRALYRIGIIRFNFRQR